MPDNQNKTEGRSIRGDISLAATYEIEALVSALLKLAGDDPLDNTSLLVRGMGSRIRELNSVIMSAVGDDSEDESSLHYRLYGEALEASHA